MVVETLSASDLSNVRVLAAEGGVRWPPLLYTDPLSECERDVDRVGETWCLLFTTIPSECFD